MTNSLVRLPPNAKIAKDSLIKKKEKKLVMGSMDKNKREQGRRLIGEDLTMKMMQS